MQIRYIKTYKEKKKRRETLITIESPKAINQTLNKKLEIGINRIHRNRSRFL